MFLWNRNPIRASRVCFDLDIHIVAFFELYLAAFVINQAIRDTNFPVKMIGALYRDLGFLGLPGARVRDYDLFDLTGKCGAGFRLFFLGHD